MTSMTNMVINETRNARALIAVQDEMQMTKDALLASDSALPE